MSCVTVSCFIAIATIRKQRSMAVMKLAVAEYNEEPCEVKVSRTVLKWQSGE